MPFVLKLPHQAAAGRVVDGVARHVDVRPTIIDLVGAPPVAGVQGRSLGPLIYGAPSARVFPAAAYVNKAGREIESYELAGYKIIRSRRQNAQDWNREVYDLGHDPDEQNGLSRSHPILRGYLAGELDEAVRHQPSMLAADEAVVSEELAERLRRLGYIR